MNNSYLESLMSLILIWTIHLNFCGLDVLCVTDYVVSTSRCLWMEIAQESGRVGCFDIFKFPHVKTHPSPEMELLIEKFDFGITVCKPRSQKWTISG